jgi:hypothetical protein
MTCGRSNREKPAAESCLAAGRGGEGSSAEPVRPGGGAGRSKHVSSLFSTNRPMGQWSDDGQVDRVRRALRRRSKPPWRVVWRVGPSEVWDSAVGARPRWRVRVRRLRLGWKLLWKQRLRRDLDPMYRLVACRRGRHRDALLVSDDLAGSPLGDDYPELAICEVCGRAVEWPNGKPTLVRREQE